MLLQELTSIELINCNLTSREKSEVIKELVNGFIKTGIISSPEELINFINERENLDTTGIGNGIAIPHARIKGVKELKVAIGISRSGIDFKSLDNKPVNIVFMIAAPEEAHKPYMQAIAKISRLLKSDTMKQALIEAGTAEKIMNIIKEFDNILPESLNVETKSGRVIYKQEPMTKKQETNNNQ